MDIIIIHQVLLILVFLILKELKFLKGPQGTKFGRNAVAGIINMITARPTGEFGGSYDIELGNFSTTQFNGHINIPISDSMRTRFALVVKKRDGTTHNIHTGMILMILMLGELDFL